MRQTIIDKAFSMITQATTPQIAMACGIPLRSAVCAVHVALKAKKIVVVGEKPWRGKIGRPVLIYALNPGWVLEKRVRPAPPPRPEKRPTAPADLVGQAIANRTALEAAWIAR